MDSQIISLHSHMAAIRTVRSRYGTNTHHHAIVMQALLQKAMEHAQPSAKRQRLSHHTSRDLSPPSDASTVSAYEPRSETTPQSRKRSAAAMLHPAPALPVHVLANLLRPANPPLLPQLWTGLRHCLPSLNIQFSSTLALAGFMWQRLRDSVLYGGRTLYFSPVHALSMSDTVLLGCLVVAIKVEECRKGAPSNARVALVCGSTPAAISKLELLVLEACDWRPLAGWVDAQRRWALQAGKA